MSHFGGNLSRGEPPALSPTAERSETMIRKSVSLLAVLGLTVTFIALNPSSIRSAPNNGGDVDPTGLDTGRRITSEVPTSLAPMSVEATQAAVMSWIKSYMLRLTLRSLGL